MANKKSAVLLECDGESVAEIKIPKNFSIENFDYSKIDMEDVEDVKGNGKIERECDFEWQEKILSVFAYNDGKAGKENKTELPPPIETQLYFGNIVVIAHKDGKVSDLPLEEYQEFYNSAFGGFEDLGAEDSWSEDDEEPNTEDEAFIVNDDEEEDDGEFVVNEEDEEEDEEFDSDEDDTEDSGEYSVHSDDSSEDDSLKLEEWNIIDSYCQEMDKELLKAPNKFRYKLYTFMEKQPEFLGKWCKEQEKKDKDMKKWTKWLENKMKK
tara:strand:- start:709 stop:1509 length:801 start_codon:yes stop_codon:yes gene_type:complete